MSKLLWMLPILRRLFLCRPSPRVDSPEDVLVSSSIVLNFFSVGSVIVNS